jgi:hypothetical protein
MGQVVDGKWVYDSPVSTPGRVCTNADTLAHQSRPAPHPGPRCSTCHKDIQKKRKKTAADRRNERVYGVTPEQHQAILEVQGGRCAICKVATGASKRLATDHDHFCTEGHDPKTGCQKCVRGLLCSNCNKIVGFFRDDPDAFARAVEYIRNPPARAVLNP